MQCRNCGFLVPQNLKFAIMKNFCPQCGEKLFTDKEMNHISMIQNRVSNQDFSRDMDEQLLYDISLFLYNEFIGGYGRILIDEEIKKLNLVKNESSNEEEDTSDSIEESSYQEELDKVKAQIREEEAARVALDSREKDVDEDVDDKVSRLKKIHKNNPLKSKNPVVRRLDS